jgi:hypothetical protein
MTYRNYTLAVMLTVLSSGLLCAQETQASQQGNLDSQIESVRSDLRADKVAIITEVMHFTPQESEAFWPIYRKYEFDSAKLGDQRVQLVKSYADKYTTLTDADAKQMTETALDVESKRVDLQKKYFKEFSKSLSGTTVAKFFQLEHRLDLLTDLQVASALPPILGKSSTTSSGAAVK